MDPNTIYFINAYLFIVKAEVLAKSLSEVANSLGVKTKAVISHMNHPLGLAVGNSLEVGLFQFNWMIISFILL